MESFGDVFSMRVNNMLMSSADCKTMGGTFTVM